MTNKQNNFTPRIKNVTTSPTELLPHNANRSAVILYNQSTNDVRLWLELEAAYILMPGQTGLEFEQNALNVLNAKTESGSAIITIWEA